MLSEVSVAMVPRTKLSAEECKELENSRSTTYPLS
jgi:hypothetical protein